MEVETSGGWKKDIISTWEVEPKLAILITYHKTDIVPKNLMTFSLMKYVPHRILYVNMTTKNAFLFEKQQLLKKYDFHKKKPEFKIHKI